MIHLPQMALEQNADRELGERLDGLLLGLVLGYAPLMGLFTAGVSRGRSIRELVLAVAILCPIVTNSGSPCWGTGLHLELAGGGIRDALAQRREPLQLADHPQSTAVVRPADSRSDWCWWCCSCAPVPIR